MTTATTTIAPRRAPLARWRLVGAGLALGVGLAVLAAVAPHVAGGLFVVALGVAWRWGR